MEIPSNALAAGNTPTFGNGSKRVPWAEKYTLFFFPQFELKTHTTQSVLGARAQNSFVSLTFQ